MRCVTKVMMRILLIKEFPVATLKERGFDRVFNILHGRMLKMALCKGLLEQIGILYRLRRDGVGVDYGQNENQNVVRRPLVCR